MNTEEKYKNQILARAKLMQSARMAKSQGMGPEYWKSHPDIQGIKFTFSLRHDILTHIAHFVWTFSK